MKSFANTYSVIAYSFFLSAIPNYKVAANFNPTDPKNVDSVHKLREAVRSAALGIDYIRDLIDKDQIGEEICNILGNAVYYLGALKDFRDLANQYIDKVEHNWKDNYGPTLLVNCAYAKLRFARTEDEKKKAKEYGRSLMGRYPQCREEIEEYLKNA